MAQGTHLSTAWPRNFRPKPNNFGALFNTLGAAIGTGGTPLTGAATTTVWVAVPGSRVWSVESAQMQGNVAAAGSAGITAQLILNSLSAAADRVQTAATSIKVDVVTSAMTDWPITASDANRTGQPGDTLRWEVVAVGTVATPPALLGVVEVAIQS